MSAVSTIILSQVPTKFNAKADIPERTRADLHCKEKRDVLNHLKFGKYKMGIAICREVCYDISPKRTLVHVECTYPGKEDWAGMDDDKYYIVKKKALPEVLLKVVEAKRLLDSERVFTIQEATDAVEISRSSFYKYKDDIFPFHENNRGRTINLMMQVDDVPGLLSNLLNKIAQADANILTIHQSIPIGGIASLTIGVEILPQTVEVAKLIELVEATQGVHYLKILGRE